jgi:hypothetical protein
LKGIFPILLGLQNPPADRPHQPAISTIQGRKRYLITTRQKPLQKLGIGQLVILARHQHAADMPENRLGPRRRLRRCHRLVSIEVISFPY